jgi:hypothetical protein
MFCGRTIGIFAGVAGALGTEWPLLRITEEGMPEGSPSSSGSTSSRSLSAALSACSALALSASSTTGPFATEGDRFESEFDMESVAVNVRLMPSDFDFGEDLVRDEGPGGNFSNAAEKDIIFAEYSSSDSLSSGIGTADAINKSSSPPLILLRARDGRPTDIGTGARSPWRRGDEARMVEARGGEEGRAVSNALWYEEAVRLGEMAAFERGDESLRLPVDSSDESGGDAARMEEGGDRELPVGEL